MSPEKTDFSLFAPAGANAASLFEAVRPLNGERFGATRLSNHREEGLIVTQRSWRPQMTASERRRGWVFFALFLFVFPYLNAWAQRALLGDAEAPAAEANVVYYALLFALALLVFWSFLRHDSHGGGYRTGAPGTASPR